MPRNKQTIRHVIIQQHSSLTPFSLNTSVFFGKLCKAENGTVTLLDSIQLYGDATLAMTGDLPIKDPNDPAYIICSTRRVFYQLLSMTECAPAVAKKIVKTIATHNAAVAQKEKEQEAADTAAHEKVKITEKQLNALALSGKDITDKAGSQVGAVNTTFRQSYRMTGTRNDMTWAEQFDAFKGVYLHTPRQWITSFLTGESNLLLTEGTVNLLRDKGLCLTPNPHVAKKSSKRG